MKSTDMSHWVPYVASRWFSCLDRHCTKRSTTGVKLFHSRTDKIYLNAPLIRRSGIQQVEQHDFKLSYNKEVSRGQ